MFTTAVAVATSRVNSRTLLAPGATVTARWRELNPEALTARTYLPGSIAIINSPFSSVFEVLPIVPSILISMEALGIADPFGSETLPLKTDSGVAAKLTTDRTSKVNNRATGRKPGIFDKDMFLMKVKIVFNKVKCNITVTRKTVNSLH